MPPEEIRNEDGKEKQDCELNAAKRLIPEIRKAHPKLKMLINVDGLYGNEPFINLLEQNRLSYISVAKVGNHKELFNWIEVNEKNKMNSKYERTETYTRKKKEYKREHKYRWCNNVPLNGKIEKEVNYFEYNLINEKGKNSYRGTWITDIKVTEENIEELVKVARARWKIENECFNTLKNRGYHLEHNYGHGKENLSMVFFTINMLAFFIDQIIMMTEKSAIEFLSKRPVYSFFEDIKNLMNKIPLDSFDEIFKIMCGDIVIEVKKIYKTENKT